MRQGQLQVYDSCWKLMLYIQRWKKNFVPDEKWFRSTVYSPVCLKMRGFVRQYVANAVRPHCTAMDLLGIALLLIASSWQSNIKAFVALLLLPEIASCWKMVWLGTEYKGASPSRVPIKCLRAANLIFCDLFCIGKLPLQIYGQDLLVEETSTSKLVGSYSV